ncbi:MAG: four helix bundle protein [Planctomycetes bacterium]|nr:four helix bundle protein [Planctomycetota bacterium]
MSYLSYKDLEIYKMAHYLAVETHKATLEFPKSEFYEQGSQLRRASKSICANIVEGFARRRYKAEFIRFLIFAYASCEETIEHLELFKETGSAVKNFDYFIEQYDILARKMNTFIKGVEREHLS